MLTAIYKFALLIFLIVFSWVFVLALTLGIFWCFALDWTIKIGTGIWLIFILINASLKVFKK